MDTIAKQTKETQSLTYRIEHEGVSATELAEKTFCFSCGCFQGGVASEGAFGR